MRDEAGTPARAGATQVGATQNGAGADDAREGAGLATSAARGALWSGFSSIVLRLGGLVVGIVLARMLTPEQFGVFAIALTVQSIVMTVADLGLSSDLVRSDDPERIAPTIATLGLAAGAATTAITVATSGMFAQLLGSPEAAPAIAVLALTLFLAGVGVVPYALLLRRFQQRELFWIGVADFAVYTVVTLLLVAAGAGVMGLAVGRVCAQAVACVLQFVLARVRPRLGIDLRRVGPILSFGLPIAGANLVAWALLNVDNVVLARIAGVAALGYYVLAFNIASWPMSALSQVVRSISLPYFSRADDSAEALAKLIAVGWALAFPACGLLAALSAPLISVLYGDRWLPAAPVLAALGTYGALRVVFDVATGYLYARGRSRPVLWIQLIWLVALVGGMLLVTPEFGIVGAAWVHVAVAVALILPAYLWAATRAGLSLAALGRHCWLPTVAAIPAVAAGFALGVVVAQPLLALLAGGLAGAAVYGLLMGRWALRELRSLRAPGHPTGAES